MLGCLARGVLLLCVCILAPCSFFLGRPALFTAGLLFCLLCVLGFVLLLPDIPGVTSRPDPHSHTSGVLAGAFSMGMWGEAFPFVLHLAIDSVICFICLVVTPEPAILLSFVLHILSFTSSFSHPRTFHSFLSACHHRH